MSLSKFLSSKSKEKTHIYWFAHYNTNSISFRYRGLYVLEALKEKYKITYSIVYPELTLKQIVRFFIIYFSALVLINKNSLIVFQKIHSNRLYSFFLKVLVKIRKEHALYDTDDADYLRYKENNINFFLKNCKYCSVGSDALGRYARKYNNNVYVLTTPIIHHNKIKTEKNKVFHLGWIGNLGQNKYKIEPFSHKLSLFNYILPAIKSIKYEFKFTLLGVVNTKDKEDIYNYLKESTHITLNIPENLNWLDEDRIYNMVQEFDLGLSPLVNHEFNIAKSAFKAKQYFSCGVPVIASPVGENMKFVKNGINGFFCKTIEDFNQKILDFITMENSNYDIYSKNALNSLSHFCLDSYCSQFFKNFLYPHNQNGRS